MDSQLKRTEGHHYVDEAPHGNGIGLHPSSSAGQANDPQEEPHHEKKSVLKKVKAKAKKIKDKIIGHDHGHHDQNEDVSEEDDDDEMIELDPEVHGAPIYESSAVNKSPRDEKVNVAQGRPAITISNLLKEDKVNPGHSQPGRTDLGNFGKEEKLVHEQPRTDFGDLPKLGHGQGETGLGNFHNEESVVHGQPRTNFENVPKLGHEKLGTGTGYFGKDENLGHGQPATDFGELPKLGHGQLGTGTGYLGKEENPPGTDFGKLPKSGHGQLGTGTAYFGKEENLVHGAPGTDFGKLPKSGHGQLGTGTGYSGKEGHGQLGTGTGYFGKEENLVHGAPGTDFGELPKSGHGQLGTGTGYSGNEGHGQLGTGTGYSGKEGHGQLGTGTGYSGKEDYLVHGAPGTDFGELPKSGHGQLGTGTGYFGKEENLVHKQPETDFGYLPKSGQGQPGTDFGNLPMAGHMQPGTGFGDLPKSEQGQHGLGTELGLPPKKDVNLGHRHLEHGPLDTGEKMINLGQGQPGINLEPFEADPHAPRGRHGTLSPGNYQSKVTDPTGAGGTEADMKPIINTLGKLEVTDEQDLERKTSSVRTGSRDQFSSYSPSIGTKNTSPPIPQSSDANTKSEYHSEPEQMNIDEPRNQNSSYTGKITSAASAIAGKAISAKDEVASKLGYGSDRHNTATLDTDEDDLNMNKDGYGQQTTTTAVGEYGRQIASTVTEKLAPVYEKVAGAGTAVVSKIKGTGTDHTGSDAGKDTGVGTGGTGTSLKEQGQGEGVTVVEFLAKRFTPGEEDKALNEIISEGLHKKKEDYPEHIAKSMDKVTESPEVARRLGTDRDDKGDGSKGGGSESGGSEGVGMVDRVKGMVGSWLGKGESGGEIREKEMDN